VGHDELDHHSLVIPDRLLGALVLINVVRSWHGGEIAGDDPWGGNTLEWATTSPPPPYNFERVPPVHSFMPLRDLHESGEMVRTEPEPAKV
jgi:heme/copper-type cytochrome/quinol oxidase subunit 1